MKISRLHILTSNSKALKMNEDETIAEFNTRVWDLANESFDLGEKLSDTKLVREVLRSLPTRFNMKVTAIEEANDITKMRLDELIGSLLTYELTLVDVTMKRKNNIAFKGVSDDPAKTCQVSVTDENLVKTVALLAKWFLKFKNKFYKTSREFRSHQSNDKNLQQNGNQNFASSNSTIMSRRKESDHTNNNQFKIDISLKCYECDGFIHYQPKCASYLKRMKKGFSITLSQMLMIHQIVKMKNVKKS